LDTLSASHLREQSMRDRYKHRRQRLRALAELKDGVSIGFQLGPRIGVEQGPLSRRAGAAALTPAEPFGERSRGERGGVRKALGFKRGF